MRFISFLSLAALLGINSATQKSISTNRDLSLSCLAFEDLSFFDVRPLQSKINDYQVKTADGSETYYFNLCGQTNKNCSSSTNGVFAFKRNDGSGECTELTDLKATKPQVIEGDTGTFIMFEFGSPAKKCTNV